MDDQTAIETARREREALDAKRARMARRQQDEEREEAWLRQQGFVPDYDGVIDTYQEREEAQETLGDAQDGWLDEEEADRERQRENEAGGQERGR